MSVKEISQEQVELPKKPDKILRKMSNRSTIEQEEEFRSGSGGQIVANYTLLLFYLGFLVAILYPLILGGGKLSGLVLGGLVIASLANVYWLLVPKRWPITVTSQLIIINYGFKLAKLRIEETRLIRKVGSRRDDLVIYKGFNRVLVYANGFGENKDHVLKLLNNPKIKSDYLSDILG